MGDNLALQYYLDVHPQPFNSQKLGPPFRGFIAFIDTVNKFVVDVDLFGGQTLKRARKKMNDSDRQHLAHPSHYIQKEKGSFFAG
jgi:hypothetical protein